MSEKFQKHSINLRPGDYERLKYYAEIHGVDASYIIRRNISKLVDQLDAQAIVPNLDKVKIDTKFD